MADREGPWRGIGTRIRDLAIGAPGTGGNSGSGNYDRLGRIRNALETTLTGFQNLAGTYDRESGARQDAAVEFARGESEASLQPTLTDRDIQDLYAEDVDRIDEAGTENASALRSMLGGAGVTGGGQAAAFATQIGNARTAAYAGAKRSLRGLRAKLDADTNVRRWGQGVQLAAMMAAPRSDAMIQAWGQTANVRMTQEGNELGLITAREQAQAMKDAADQEWWETLAGGAFSLARKALPFG